MNYLSLEARKKLIELLLLQDKEIRDLFIHLADNIAKEILTRQEQGRAYEYLQNIDLYLRNELSVLEEGLRELLDNGLLISVEAGLHQSKQATMHLLKKANIDWKPIERSYFRVNQLTVEAMWQRTIKGLNLSDRIWEKSKNVNRAIGDIIREAIAQGEHPVKVAEMLQRYVRDGANSLAVEYPNMIERLSVPNDLSYESLRLARTEMASAYGDATIQGAKMNPSTKGIKWSLSNAGVACDVCKDNANRDEGMGKGVYTIDSLPQYPAHPNCLCVLSEVVEDTDDFVDRLIEWNKNPTSQPDLEQWYQTL